MICILRYSSLASNQKRVLSIKMMPSYHRLLVISWHFDNANPSPKLHIPGDCISPGTRIWRAKRTVTLVFREVA